MTQKPVFRPIESKEVPYLQLWITATIISLFIVLVVYTLLMIFYFDFLVSISMKKILITIVLLIVLFNTLICESNKYYFKRSIKEYNKVIIDNNGITFLNHYTQTIIAKILWKNIQPRENEKFDVDFYFKARNRTFSIYFFWSLKESNDSKIPLWSANKFALMFAKFSNKTDLLKALLLGITTFKPDITVNPFIYSFHKLDPVSLEMDKAGIKKENKMTLLIILFSVIMSLIIVFVIYVFSL